MLAAPPPTVTVITQQALPFPKLPQIALQGLSIVGMSVKEGNTFTMCLPPTLTKPSWEVLIASGGELIPC